MNKALPLALGALLILPSAASAATADADVKRRGGISVGPVTFKAAKGERNRLSITNADGIVFRDSANRVVAKGDCVQVDRHTARCPFSEDGGVLRLGNRNDRARFEGERLSLVAGGSGNDVLRGSAGRQVLAGDGGKDELHGDAGNDELTVGPDATGSSAAVATTPCSTARPTVRPRRTSSGAARAATRASAPTAATRSTTRSGGGRSMSTCRAARSTSVARVT